MDDSNLTALFNALPVALLCCGRDGRVVAATDAALALMGATRAGLVGYRLGLPPWVMVLPNGQLASFTDLPSRVAIDEGRAIGSVVLGLRHEGRPAPTWLRVRAEPVQGAGERARRAWLHIEPASEPGPRAVPASPTFLPAALDLLPVPAVVLARDGAIVHANEAAGVLLGLSPAELAGQRLDSPGWQWRTADGVRLDPSELPFVGVGQRQATESVVLGLTSATGRRLHVRVHVRPWGEPRGSAGGTLVVFEQARESTAEDLEDGHQGFFERNLSVMLLIDPEDGRIVDANPAACEFYGWPRARMLGLRVADITVLAGPGAEREFTVDRQEDSGVYRLRHRLASGEVRDVEVRSSPVRRGGKAVVHAIVFDVTDRLRAEAASLRSSKEVVLHERIGVAGLAGASAAELVRVACAGIADALHVDDALALVVDRGRAVATVVHATGSAGALDGTSVRCDHVPIIASLAGETAVVALADAQWGELGAIGSVLARGGAHSFLVASVLVEGALAAVLVFGCRCDERMASGDVSAFVARTAARIADALATANLERVRRQLLAAIEKTSEVVIVTDAIGDIVYANPAFERVTGFAKSEAVGSPVALLEGEDRADSCSWNDRLRTSAWRGRMNQRKKDGSVFVVDAVVTPVAVGDAKPSFYVAVLRDVTRELELERQMLQAQKMEGIGRLAGGLAHDFNNTLAAVMGYAGLVRARIAPDHPAHGDILEIQDTILRARNLSRQLLTFARRQIIQPRRLDLGEVILTLDKMLRRLIGEDIELVTVPASGLWGVMADPGQIEQIVVNLVVNARDAMPGGGKLVIETGNVELSAADVASHPDARAGAYVMLSVTDTGTGMSEEIRTHLFEPFFTTKEPDKGTGLGLATCFGIAHQSGGFIAIDSKEGAGTCARVYFPKDEKSDSDLLTGRALVELPEGTETILVAEDDPVMRRLACRLLQAHGYQVLAAANGEEALRVADAHVGPIDLLLTDVVMPRLGARELIREMRDRRPDTRVVLMSGYPDDEELRAGAENRRIAFLSKPFTELVLVYKIREVLDGWPD